MRSNISRLPQRRCFGVLAGAALLMVLNGHALPAAKSRADFVSQFALGYDGLPAGDKANYASFMLQAYLRAVSGENLEQHDDLCFNTWAIEHGLQRVEAGAQGRHKIQRGYLPQPTYSAHWIAHKGLRHAIANYLDDERRGIHAEMAHLAEQSPFRKDCETD